MNSDTGERYLTARDVAERFALSPHTVIDWAESGRIPSFKLGRAVRFKESELNTWIEQQRR